MKILAIDVGGTEIKYGIVDEFYNLTEKNYIKTPKDTLDDFLKTIYDIYSLFDGIDAVCISLPGFVDTKNNKHLGGGHFHSLKDTYLKDLIEEKCHTKCFLENDGKAATIAEYYLGNLKGTTNSSVYIIGTGIGGGLIINSKLLKGLNYTAGEYSYINIDTNISDPRISSMAEICSTRALLKNYKDETNQDIDGREFFRRININDSIAIRLLDDFANNIAIQIMNLGILLNVEKVAIGGGISAQDILIEKIKEKLDDLALLKIHPECNLFKPIVVRCKYGNDANLLGVTYEYLNNLEDK